MDPDEARAPRSRRNGPIGSLALELTQRGERIGPLLIGLVVFGAVFADAVMGDELTLWVRMGVLALLGVLALFWPPMRQLTGFVLAMLLVAVAVASGYYAVTAPPKTVASPATTAEFAIDACRITSLSAITAEQSLTVVFVLPAPGESGQPAFTTLAVQGTAGTAIEASATPCPEGASGSMVRIRVDRGEAHATAQNFARGVATASAIFVLPN